MKPVIVATHMLESMIANPIPTRAEVTDVANAVFEQADAIMLSGETANGKYPPECVTVLDRVAERTERSGNAGYTSTIELHNDYEHLVSAAVHLADQIRAKALVVFTRRGVMAQISAGLRPRYSPTYAFCPDERMTRKLNLMYGVKPFHLEFHDNPDLTVAAAEFLLKDLGYVVSGDKLVIISDLRKGDQIINSLQLRTLA
jgi:pyruvate kinase